MNEVIKISKSKILVVEGKHEEFLFASALTSHLKISDVQILPVGGKDQIRGSLLALTKDPSFPQATTLAVIRDADATALGAIVTSAAAAFQSIVAALANAGLPSPAAHAQFSAGTPRVGVFIMPDGIRDGALETLCIDSVATLPEFNCVKEFFACLKTHGIQPSRADKAFAHAWLASKPKPDCHVGLGAKEGYWRFSEVAFNKLWDFLRAM